MHCSSVWYPMMLRYATLKSSIVQPWLSRTWRLLYQRQCYKIDTGDVLSRFFKSKTRRYLPQGLWYKTNKRAVTSRRSQSIPQIIRSQREVMNAMFMQWILVIMMVQLKMVVERSNTEALVFKVSRGYPLERVGVLMTLWHNVPTKRSKFWFKSAPKYPREQVCDPP